MVYSLSSDLALTAQGREGQRTSRDYKAGDRLQVVPTYLYYLRVRTDHVFGPAWLLFLFYITITTNDAWESETIRTRLGGKD
jgi:hypothetical protein